MKYRLPVVSDSFYAGSAKDLNNDLTALFCDIPSPDICPKALIVPHAGYIYSGDVAAHAYAYLLNFKKNIKRVVILGPSHRVALQGCAISSYDAFTTPLGNVVVDKKGCQQLLELGLVQELDQAHDWEHSLEVQLPFLQYCLNDFCILPIVVGLCQPEDISKILSVFNDNADTIFIISTDLSHYHSYVHAQALDNYSIEKILNLVPCLEPNDACGSYAVNGLLQFCRDHNWQLTLVKKANSGDYCQEKNKVVGYASFLMY